MRLPFKRPSLTAGIIIALIVGIVIGAFFPEAGHWLKPFRTVFLNGVKCIIAPLIFASIVCGIGAAGSARGLGRTGLVAMIWFEISSGAALIIGLLFVNILHPGRGAGISKTIEAASALPNSTNSIPSLTFAGFVEHLIPQNFAEAVVRGDVLQVVVFSIIFGTAVLLAGERGKVVFTFCESLLHVMFRFTELIMHMAPFGVCAAVASSIADQGPGVILPMIKLIGSLYLALAVFVGIVLIPALVWARVNVRAFFRELRPAITLAFATTSSESAYPSALEALNKMGVPNSIASFVLPLGYSFNLDGSTLYLAIASVTIAQAAGINLPLRTQLAMMFTLMITTKGVAAVPRASFVVLSATLTAFGLPLEGIALILGVDAFMDMARTAVNLLGNCVATAVITRWQGQTLAAPFVGKRLRN